MKKIVLKIGGMTCSACSSGLEKYLNKQAGVKNANVNLVLSIATIEYENISKKTIEIYIKEAGFESLGEFKGIDDVETNKSDKVKLIFLGIKKINTMIEDISEMIVSKTKPITAFITDCSMSLGNTKIIITSRTICSMILLVAWGTIFCLPEKYPFKTLEIDTKGKVKAIAIKIGPAFGSFNRFIAIKSWVKNIMMIRTKLIERIKAAADVKILMLRPLASATNLDMDIGIASVDIVSNKE